jgi:hypothetical protein
MTSTVTDTISGLDLTYPVAGQDNDTQGFRDNFTIINQAFTATSLEITSLQFQLNNAITTSTAFATTIATTVTNTVLSNITATVRTIVANSLTNYYTTASVKALIQSSLVDVISTSSRYTIAAPTTSKGGFGDTKGMIFATTATIYVCHKSWINDGTDIWAKVTATTSPL